MKQAQVCVVGGGCVGLTLALGLAKANVSVIVIDAAAKQQLPGDDYGLRVSALSLASQALFESIGVWPQIVAQRARAYTHMDVRDQDSFGKIAFNSDELDLPQLGHIVENDIIRYALINELEKHSQATLMFETRYQQIHQSENDVFVTLESGEPIIAKLLVAADGANSSIRKQFNLPITFKDYDHNAIVATVKTAEPHNNTARQVFLPTGPLAFLPLTDKHTHSIVWSTSPEHCQSLLAMDDADFNKAVMAALDGQCGLCEIQSQRAAFPLKMRYAQQWVAGKVVLIGDAAHTIHPLAGLGMNLGLKDASYLIELLSEQNTEFASDRTLRDYERTRKLDAQKHIAMMQGLKELFAGTHPVKKLIRGVGLSMVDNLGPIKHLFAKQAIGK
ncbi:MULTISPECIES: FAD-dependent monooxygenase [unclassified Pseudoalteromonas]|uniref:FAD-dependent monooxygenase n=1 Tax=unclassified Pseudoalteromonas TaxID=194690 RepID=UPI000B3C5750|nr:MULTISPECIES: FAD-dependent monooxygenase [unclassified Pseudoalteromonas]MDN3379248.1 FAD-dependent monooxygenase [Pseudoalteromonas sp. APC 3893]MDN3386422.1 FAD-dependent monooxygenase [Pseudoalteromonas sp. APC 4017]OUS71277.1 monooxygenase [Pseudoalteromonas sp. A601]